jgi:hypothetical protein
VTLTVYLLAGVSYNKFKGESGVELVPNISFWREFPGLVQDGFTFTIGKIRGN